MDQPTTNTSTRKRGLWILAALVIVGGAIWVSWWFLVGRQFESTEDAYVSSDMIQVTAEAAGTILAVHVDDTQTVKRGDVLAELDPADASVAMSAAEAQLARAVRSVRAMYAQRSQLQAQIRQRQVDVERAERDVKRRDGLVSDGVVSNEELAHANDAVTVARAALEVAREQYAATAAQIDGTTLATHPQVLDAAAAVRNAALALHRMELRAPADGVVAKRSVQVGQRVAPGAPLMALVPLQSAWVEANFKEGQLRTMRVGQPVELHADLYGGDVTFHGRVAGVGAGSGSAFALLPAQNASGNWIKIVQRLPVRIVLDPKELQDHPVRLGMSMSAKVNVQQQDDGKGGVLAAVNLRANPQPAQASAGIDPDIDQRIASIVAQNDGVVHKPAASAP